MCGILDRRDIYVCPEQCGVCGSRVHDSIRYYNALCKVFIDHSCRQCFAQSVLTRHRIPRYVQYRSTPAPSSCNELPAQPSFNSRRRRIVDLVAAAAGVLHKSCVRHHFSVSSRRNNPVNVRNDVCSTSNRLLARAAVPDADC